MPKAFVFDAGFLGTFGLTFNFSRPWVTVNDDGSASGEDEPRYTMRSQLLCGIPVVTDELTSNNNFQAIGAAGLDADGTTPLCCHVDWSAGSVDIYSGALSGSPSHQDMFAGHSYGAATHSKRGQYDLLLGESDEEEQLLYVPDSFTICHGVVVAVCSVRRWLAPIEFTVTAVTHLAGNKYKLTPSAAVPVYNVRNGGTLYLPKTTATLPMGLEPRNSTSEDIVVTSSFTPTTGVATIPQWEPFASAVCYWQDSAGGDGEWHPIDYDDGSSLHPQGPERDPPKERGSSFNFSGHRILTTDSGIVKEFYVPFGDYINNFDPSTDPWHRDSSDFATYFLARFERTGTSAVWTPGLLVPVLTLENINAPTGLHAHCCYLEPHGNSGGMRLVCAVGDTWSNNRVAIVYRDDRNYDDGPADPTSSPTNGWTVRDNLHGHELTGSHYAADGNQFVGHSPLGTTDTPLGHVNGSDEFGAAIVKLGPLGNGLTTDRVTFTRAWGVTPASIKHSSVFNAQYGWQVFFMRCHYPEFGWEHVALLNVGQAGLSPEAGRILYSVDGELWGECFCPGASKSADFFAGSIVFTTDNYTTGVRSFPAPAYTVQKPLIVGKGGRNILIDEVEIDDVGTGNSVTQINPGDRPAGVPLPPCNGPMLLCETPTSGGSMEFGLWRLTGTVVPSGLPGSGTNIKVRAYVYPLSTAQGGESNAMSVELSPWQYDIPLTSREQWYCAPLQCAGSPDSGWYPQTFDTNTSVWKGDVGSSPVPPSSDPFAFGFRARHSYQLNPGSFLIAFDYVDYGDDSGPVDHAGVALPLGGTSAPEYAEVAGFACGSSFTIELVAQVPDDAWDQTVPLGSRPAMGSRPLCTINDYSNGRWIKVFLDVANQAVVFQSQPPSGIGTVEVSVKPSGSSPESFFFSRGSVVYIAIVGTTIDDETALECYASVGHAQLCSAQLGGIAIAPNNLTLADGANVEAMYWWGGRVNESSALSAGLITSSAKNLSFLYRVTSYLPPWSSS